MYVCPCVYVYVCIYTHAHAEKDTHVQVYAQVHILSYVYVNMYVRVCTYVYTSVCVCVCVCLSLSLMYPLTPSLSPSLSLVPVLYKPCMCKRDANHPHKQRNVNISTNLILKISSYNTSRTGTNSIFTFESIMLTYLLTHTQVGILVYEPGYYTPDASYSTFKVCLTKEIH